MKDMLLLVVWVRVGLGNRTLLGSGTDTDEVVPAPVRIEVEVEVDNEELERDIEVDLARMDHPEETWAAAGVVVRPHAAALVGWWCSCPE